MRSPVTAKCTALMAGAGLAVTILVGCSSGGHSTSLSIGGSSPGPTTAVSSPNGTTPSSASGLTEDSTCQEFLNASEQDQLSFLLAEVQAHFPQTHASFTMAGPGGSPSVANGNVLANGLSQNFLWQALKSQCPTKPSARVGDLLAPAWTGQSSTP